MQRVLIVAGLILVASGCNGAGLEDEMLLGSSESPAVSLALLQSRSDTIKAVHASHAYIHNPLIFAGIAYTETQMAHCYSEYYNQVSTYVCAGPTSTDCGGAVTAGYWDGPCGNQAGGLGMWQFDEGNYTQTLNKWNTSGYWNGQTHNILSISDSSSAAIDFILFKAWYSSRTPYFSSYQAMYDWINGIRPVDGNSDFETWLGFLAYNYNGQAWGSQGWYDTVAKYRSGTHYLHTTLGGDAYWYNTAPPSTYIVDDLSTGFTKYGPGAYWYQASIGYASHMWWTYVNGTTKSNYARWKPTLSAGAGNYEVKTYIPSNYATSQQAKYRIYHQGVNNYYTINQNVYYNAWVSLGTYYFTANGTEYVELADNTGEAYSTGRMIGFDAVKFIKK